MTGAPTFLVSLELGFLATRRLQDIHIPVMTTQGSTCECFGDPLPLSATITGLSAHLMLTQRTGMVAMLKNLRAMYGQSGECGRNEGYFFYKRLNCYLPEMPHDSVITYKSNCSKTGFQFLMLEMILSPEAVYRDYHRSFALTLSHYSISRNFIALGVSLQTAERWEPAHVT